MSDALRFTIRYFDGGEGWIMGPGRGGVRRDQPGRTRDEARANVTDAPRLMLKPQPHDTVDPDRESLELPLAS